MTEGGAMSIKRESTWQLLLELVLPSRLQVVERITAAVQGLGIQPAQAGRVEQAAMEALRAAMWPCGRDRPDSAIAVRLWTSDAPADGPRLPAPGALEAGLLQDRGWGFFVIQTQEDELPASIGGSRHLVDLFLYQEG
jgi:hypothetical protein